MDSILQYYIELIPKELIGEKYGQILTDFNANSNNGFVKPPIYNKKNRKIIKDLWEKENLNFSFIIPYIEKLNFIQKNDFFTKSEEGKYLFGRLSKNYCCLEHSTKSESITYLQFAIDLTTKESKEFVLAIINLAQEFNCVLIDSQLNVFSPLLNEVNLSIKKSPAYPYLLDEKQFIENVKKGQQKTGVPFFYKK